ncbi:MAG: gamma-glutamyl-gamma-aminobutyrate hydrolase family protein [Patescibacteria group bacterium]
MKILLIDNHTKHVQDWKRLAKENNLDLVVVSCAEPEISQEIFDLIILSGGTGLPVTRSRDVLKKEIEIIKNSSKPILGVCLGFELIADTFGATLLYREKRVSGFSRIRVSKNDPMFAGLDEFSAKEAHKFYLETLPKGLEELARSESGVEVFKHRTRLIYGFQFHPEIISPENQGTQVFLNLLKRFWC